jgi:hypothetical protein
VVNEFALEGAHLAGKTAEIHVGEVGFKEDPGRIGARRGSY